ncbi:MAG: alpha/beta fold hydrolase [Myxococcota bacterium]
MKADGSAFQLGDPRDGGAPAVLCIHGLTGTPYEVRPPAEALAAAGFHCHGPLLPGHLTRHQELAATPRSAWLEAVVAAHDALAQRHARVYVLGLSLGGVLALALAQRRRVAGAVVLAAPIDLGRLVRFAVPLLWPLLGSLPKTPAILDDEARARHPGYDRMPLRSVSELCKLGREVERRLGQVRAPVQLIYSRRDPTVPPHNAERILRGLAPGEHELHWLEDSAHVLPVDRERERIARLVVDFLQRLEKAASG